MSTPEPTATIHPSADVEDDVVVGSGTTVWHRAQIRRGARLGTACIVGRDAYIDAGVTVGDRVKIQNGALVYHGVTVGAGALIGPGAVLTNDRYPRAVTTSGALAHAEDWTVTPTRNFDSRRSRNWASRCYRATLRGFASAEHRLSGPRPP